MLSIARFDTQMLHAKTSTDSYDVNGNRFTYIAALRGCRLLAIGLRRDAHLLIFDEKIDG